MASDLITGIRTASGTKQIDYAALANKDHAAQHASSGSDPITPAAIGAALAAHAAQHATNGADPISLSDIGAASQEDFANLLATAVKSISGSLVDANGNAVTIPNSQISGAVKIQTGSYVGTGTYGASNPCSLTFNKIHKRGGVSNE